MADPQGSKWHEMILGGQGAAAAIDIIQSFGKGTISKAIMPVPGTRAYQSAWDETIKAAEEANEPGSLHRLHRLRVDLEHRRQQPAPQRDLPRQRDQGRRDRAVHDDAAARQRQSGRSLEMDGRLRREDRRQRARHRAQRQSVERPHVPDRRGLRQAGRPRLRRESRQVGAPLRGDADQGRRRGAPVPVAQRRVRELREAGTRATSTAARPRPRTCSSSSMRDRPQERPACSSRSSA